MHVIRLLPIIDTLARDPENYLFNFDAWLQGGLLFILNCLKLTDQER